MTILHALEEIKGFLLTFDVAEPITGVISHILPIGFFYLAVFALRKFIEKAGCAPTSWGRVYNTNGTSPDLVTDDV